MDNERIDETFLKNCDDDVILINSNNEKGFLLMLLNACYPMLYTLET
jgi:hypothetical protein